jgi:hypothetical protein
MFTLWICIVLGILLIIAIALLVTGDRKYSRYPRPKYLAVMVWNASEGHRYRLLSTIQSWCHRHRKNFKFQEFMAFTEVDLVDADPVAFMVDIEHPGHVTVFFPGDELPPGTVIVSSSEFIWHYTGQTL